MKRYFKFATSTNKVYYCTSVDTAKNYFDKNLNDHDNAVFAGEEIINQRFLFKVQRGIYLYKK